MTVTQPGTHNEAIADSDRHGNPPSFLIGLAVSVLLFSNQQKFVGYLARMFPQLGDITFFVGFLIAGGCYLVLARPKIRVDVAAAPVAP
jgi:purine-cytosine permease-like protein